MGDARESSKSYWDVSLGTLACALHDNIVYRKVVILQITHMYCAVTIQMEKG